MSEESEEVLYDEAENATIQTVIQNRYSFYCLPYSLFVNSNSYEDCIKLIGSFQTVRKVMLNLFVMMKIIGGTFLENI